jgi:soluble lytic murein transglycosylase-like protein
VTENRRDHRSPWCSLDRRLHSPPAESRPSRIDRDRPSRLADLATRAEAAGWLAVIGCCLTCLACGGPGDPRPRAARIGILERAFAVRDTDPESATDLFRQAGSGPSLERARFEAWFSSLDRFTADSDQWQAFLDAGPPTRLAGRATLAWASALAIEDRSDRAIEILEDAPASVRHLADIELLESRDAGVVLAAAHRLARAAPHLLRNHSVAIEREALEQLDHDGWMARAAAWRAAGLGSRGASELRRLRRRGAEERQRRIELALCELDAGSTTRALNALPATATADPEELALRAEAYRRRGWSRIPNDAAVAAFRDCFELARRSVASTAPGPPREDALVLIVECGTEVRSLDAALQAWWRLEAMGWSNGRRGWLGRRLGIALARTGRHQRETVDLASCLPTHRRCLEYWLAASNPDPERLQRLAEEEITDLYGRWAALHPMTRRQSDRWQPAAGVGTTPPPSSVGWLLDHGGLGEASDEWQRVLRRRRPGRAEAIAAADLAARAGRPNTAIRTLLKAFPELNSVAISDVPGDAITAYLPLRWPDHIRSCARETRLDPWLIAAVARQESTFSAHARSPAGARGVMQLIPATARLHARALGLGSQPDLEDPAVNLRLGAHELRDLIRRFGALEPALAAYNAGERRVRRWWRRWPERREFTESIPIPETYTYVRRVVFLSEAYRQAHAAQWRTTP